MLKLKKITKAKIENVFAAVDIIEGYPLYQNKENTIDFPKLLS